MLCEWQPKKYWPTVLNTCPIKIGINFSKEETFVFEVTRFQLQQKEAFVPRHRLSTITTLPIPSSYCCVATQLLGLGR